MSLTVRQLIEWAELQNPDHIITIRDTDLNPDQEETNIHLEKAPGSYNDEFVIDARQATALD